MNEKKFRRYVLLGFVLLSLVAIIAVGATEITVTTAKGPFPGSVSADDLNATVLAYSSVTVQPATFVVTGNELLVAISDVDGGTVSLISQPISGRTGHISDYVIDASEVVIFNYSTINGWGIQGGWGGPATAYIAGVSSGTTINFAVIKY